MQKRNKKTMGIARIELSKLTEHILAGMGEEGKNLRDRLIHFLEERMIPQLGSVEKSHAKQIVGQDFHQKTLLAKNHQLTK